MRNRGRKRSNLPAQLMQLIWREREVAQVRTIALSQRAPGHVDCPGRRRQDPPGAEAVAELLDAFIDGMFVVSLALDSEAVFIVQTARGTHKIAAISKAGFGSTI